MKKLLICLLFLLTACSEKPVKMYKYSYQKVETNSNQTQDKEPKLVLSHQGFNKAKRDEQLGKDEIEISEKLFITQINDIYYNFEDYKDKTIIVEGMFTELVNLKGDKKPAVYRKGPGCCGNDGWGGFILKYDGAYPNENEWIRVKGKLELVEKDRFKDLFLHVEELEVKQERGAEYVGQ